MKPRIIFGGHHADSVSTIADTIGADSPNTVAAVRGEVFTTLHAWGIDPGANDGLNSFAASPSSYLDGTPSIVEAAA